MRFLGVIPARGGSKRLPGKNIKPLGGQPLIAWTIRAAQDSGVCVDVLVSTDDAEIAEVSRQYGATVPNLRPAALATDTASSVDVAVHVIDEYERSYGVVDGLILLQPTSPFRTASMIQRGVQLFEKAGGQRSVVSVSAAASHPAWCFHIDDTSGMQPFVDWGALNKRSQDLEPAYALDGALYIIAPTQLRQDHGFVAAGSVAVITADRIEGIDIDTEFDWLVAEAAVKSGQNIG